MKRALLLLLMLSGIACAQDVKLAKNGLPMDAAIISLATDLDKDSMFSTAGRVLFDNGYEVKNSDKSIGTIQTDNHIVKGSIRIRLSISIESNATKIRGRVIVPGAIDDDLTNLKGINGIYLLAFSEMDRIAKLLPHTAIKYSPTTTK